LIVYGNLAKFSQRLESADLRPSSEEIECLLRIFLSKYALPFWLYMGKHN